MTPVFELDCPSCKIRLIENTLCPSCGKKYPWLKEGRLISFQADSDEFYQRCYDGIWKSKSDTRLPFKHALMAVYERLSLSARRERFFRHHLNRKNNPVILDVACGGGRKLFKEYGRVIGLDIVLEPLYGASEIYDLCVHADAFSSPFPSDYFDYIVSSDFLGHIPLERKGALYQEFRRVLKPNGKMVHVMETDANNWHFRFAHRYPELFQKYFVEGIGGHFGLELPSKAIRRLEANGFQVLEAKKIWGELWEIQGYKLVFDNEYKQKSKMIAAIVILSKALSANVLVREAINIALNPVSAISERLTPLDNGQGLMVVCQKA
jgi:ubiquinone/menaquinone biosynthesis C-methylase UbiE